MLARPTYPYMMVQIMYAVLRVLVRASQSLLYIQYLHLFAHLNLNQLLDSVLSKIL